ncbi:hypothetical protein [Paenibacillus sp. UNC496MF]|uniref:hypothetical protein n=1 Tax=Paenibacillus sp. UNC496MF TaxID=1502753 RepID=UPI000B8323C9|nr:hypothetical protein [Paenibacillus sp. UNC496MF]
MRESMLPGTGRTITVGGPGAAVQGFSSSAVQAAVEELRRDGEGHDPAGRRRIPRDRLGRTLS